ncbi:hypothetical protein ANCCEY_12239 [Ancylostoma ceylanicum]|uniref:BIG2 domain-containing protein n=1 Tax=Ancylostoma ceylanicum TaxID=53326 RepID=A0A0D6LFF3_9BILA|nr:hypothetical protein ANCCEY_12239 [Ancylostoma ceylanicum]
MLSCGVTVDQISKVRIKTTTKILFVDAAPARILVEALNAEGDTFSTLGEIPVVWDLSHTGESRPLRIVPFEQSTYDAPAEIVALENAKKKGYIILVEGVQTGSATLTAKFVDAHLKDIPSHTLDLTVVANLLLVPAHDLFLPLNAVVPFQVHIIRQSSTEMVAMPSSSYYLKVDSESICSLDKMTSSIRALARGRTDIHLFSYNVDVKAKAGVRPPSTSINVVDPESIQWVVSDGGNWLLEIGTRYKFSVMLLDPQGNSMFISDNLRFDSIVPSDYFEIHETSKNQTYFEVTPKKNEKEQQTTGKITGEQPVQIVDAIRITPSEAVRGGSGLYDWSAEDTTVCVVDSNGLLSCSSLGTTAITASDKRNSVHKDVIRVSVVDVLSLTFGDSPKEAEVGSHIVLNIQLVGAGPNGPIPFTDCRAADFHVLSSDDAIFKHVLGPAPTLPTKCTGCSTVVMKAISSGDAKITVSFARHEATIVLSAYPALKVAKESLALAVGSSLNVRFEGGPRPWVLNSSSYFRVASADKLVTANILDGVMDVKCGPDSGLAHLLLTTASTKLTIVAFGSCENDRERQLDSVDGFAFVHNITVTKFDAETAVGSRDRYHLY